MLIVETDVLKKRIKQMKKYDNQKRVYIDDVLKVIDGASRFSRIDEDVTRCQNCRYWYAPWCLVSGHVQSPNYYCANGRSKLL